MRTNRPKTVAAGLLLLSLSVAGLGPAIAQLPAGNAAGVATGHIHLTVPDVEKHREIWLNFGAVPSAQGRLQLLGFPGMYILLTEREPTGPSAGSTVDHVAFAVQDLAAYRIKVLSTGAGIVVDSDELGLILADLPDGVRVEFQQNDSIEHPIEFHHVHLATPDAESVRDWYVETFGAEVSSRRDMPSALVPGGRVDTMAAEQATAPSRGRAIDHIGFEIDDLDAFAERLRAKGVSFDREPTAIEAIGLKIAFITDPIGTYIELTEGLRD